ncbi:MAG: GNAT family N-acetyltransferase [Deltaproteobacteria bacterium]|nr:GNAT family N-acetyltransferase [Deltaproteobacteria bacterium]
MDVRPLVESDRRGVRDLLARAPVVNLHLLTQLEGPGPFHGFFGAFDARGSLCGVVQATPSGFASPWTIDLEAARALGAYLRGRLPVTFLLGPRATCDAFWAALAGTASPRRTWDQRLWVCTTPWQGPLPEGFRRARESEAGEVSTRNGAMMLEDLGYDPSFTDPVGHGRAVLARVREGRTWVMEIEGGVRFQIDVGPAGPRGVLVGGTWVDPSWRGRGVCVEGMRALVRVLLAHHPVVALHLHEDNAPAAGCYHRAGFRPDAPLRLLLAG